MLVDIFRCAVDDMTFSRAHKLHCMVGTHGMLNAAGRVRMTVHVREPNPRRFLCLMYQVSPR